jgi:DNA polymerase-3 subunit beta
MQLSTLQSNLNKQLPNVVKVTPKNPQLPILSSILLEAKDGVVTLASTDLNTGIKTQVEGDIIKDGRVAIPGSIFADAIKNMPAQKIEFTLEDQQLTLKGEKSTTQISVFEATDFPEFPQADGEFKNLSREMLDIIVRYVHHSASIDQARLILTTILFKQMEDHLEVVATDGFRLGVLKLKTQLLEVGQQFLIPASTLLEVARMSAKQTLENIGFRVSAELKQIFFQLDGIELNVRLIEGEYPPYEKIIPPSFATKVEFDCQEMETQLKQAMVLAKEVSNIVTLEFTKDKFSVKAKSSAHGVYEGNLDFTLLEGESGEVSFNAKYLQDFISNVKPERIWMGLNDKLKPVMFKEVENDQFEYVVMPFRLNE